MHPRRLYAHRGASAERPENTLPAFARAVEVGVDALELDVHATRDGHLIVVHDPTAQRTCGSPLAWADLDLAEAQRLDAGWGFVAPDGKRPFAGQGISVPTFEQVLVEFPRVRVNVDLKGERAVDLALALLRRLGAEDRVTVASFQLRTLTRVRRQRYSGETSLAQPEVVTLLSLPAVLWRQLPYTGDAAQVPTHQGPIRFDRPTFIAKCHSLGLRVDYWVVDDRAEAARLLELGADGIMTNDPAALRPLFADE
jgi:glycerophosphoryl diester phosphodiesterase